MIQIGQKPGGIVEPIEHLVACHGRILDKLETLERIADALEGDPASAQQALANTIRFFDVTARLHTEDEEHSIFPRLRSHLSPADVEYLDSLESDHREKERVYAQLKATPPEHAAEFRALTRRLCELYRKHIASENEILVKLGRESLDETELSRITEEMRARRSTLP